VAMYAGQPRYPLQAAPQPRAPAQSAAQPAPVDRPRSSASSAGAASVANSAKSQPSAKPQPATVVRPGNFQLHMPCSTFLLSACCPCCCALHAVRERFQLLQQDGWTTVTKKGKATGSLQSAGSAGPSPWSPVASAGSANGVSDPGAPSAFDLPAASARTVRLHAVEVAWMST
jgi:hypothetical protein